MTVPGSDKSKLPRRPLTPTVFHILLALVDGPVHGYRIMLDVQERSDDQVGLGLGTLYGAIDRMATAGLIEASPGPAGARGEKRRRYYALTPSGREALVAESQRFATLVEYARDKALIPDTEAS